MSPESVTEYCLPLAECGGAIDTVGGKNASLGALMDAGAPVPPGFAVTTAAYRAFLDANDLQSEIEAATTALTTTTDDAVEHVAADIQASIRDAAFPSELVAAIDAAWDDLSRDSQGDGFSVAVRSSATAEDRPDMSFAGQHDTYLHVTTRDELRARVRDCMASLFTARAIRYREENDVSHLDVDISVGVQRMVPAAVAGVLFTLNPSNGDRSTARIEANWGLGESIVSGLVTPDSYLVDKPSGTVVERDIAEKTQQIVAADEGTEVVPVPEEDRTTPCLSTEELDALIDVGKTLERAFGTPQDIEWVLGRNADFPENLFVVQSRPETTWN